MIRVVTMLSLSALLITSCRNHKMNDMEEMKNINYPSAYVVNGEDATISVIRLSDNTVTETLKLMGDGNSMVMWPHHIYQHASVDMTHLAIAVPGMDLSAGHSGAMPGMTGKVLIMDAVKGMVTGLIEVPVMNHNAVYSPDGKEIWTSQMGMNGKVLVYDAATYVLKNTIAVGMGPAEVTFSPDGGKAYVANGEDDTIAVIDPLTKTVIATIPVGDNPVAAWLGYDGNMYVDNEDGQSVSVISIATNTVMQTIPLGFMPGSVAHNSQRKELWITDPVNGKVHFYIGNVTANQWAYANAFNTAPGAHAVAFTNDGQTAYVTNQASRNVSVINTITHSKIKDIPVGKKPNGILIKY